MKKEIRTIDEKKQILQVTTVDERWYCKPILNEAGLPAFEYVPSSTWIASSYPKGVEFFKWLASKGWNEAEAIKTSAGIRGSRVHSAINQLENDGQIAIETAFPNEQTLQMEGLSTEELICIQSFATWYNKTKPKCLASELTVFGDGYAGTLDKIYKINGQVWIVDFKTSQHIWEEMILQVSSYSEANIDYLSIGITKEEWDKRKLAILQVGYRLNKKGFKFTEIENKYNLFLMAKAIWANENPESKPKQRDIPLIIKINKE